MDQSVESLNLVRQKPLIDQVAEIIIRRIHDSTYKPGSQLPTENQLAEELGISRTTARSAYDVIRARGLIYRRHGVGTFVSQLPSIANPYEEGKELDEIITQHGYRSGFIQIKAEVIKATATLADILEIETGTEILEVHKVYTADDIPIILFINHYPGWVFQAGLKISEATQPGLTEPPEIFLLNYCNIHMVRFNSIIYPEMVSRVNLPGMFNIIDPNSAMLIVEDIGFDDRGRKVFYSIEHLTKFAARFELNRSTKPRIPTPSE